MHLITASGKFRNNILRKKFSITAGNIYIHIRLAQIPVKHSFETIHFLYLIEQQIIHTIISNPAVNISHKLFRIYATLFLSHCNKTFTYLLQIIGRIESKTDNMRIIYTA